MTRTPQENGVTERKNKIMQDMVRTILIEANLQKNFQGEVINTTIYIINRA